ncbi:hypothetical protein AAH091_15875 [Candidatus Bacteroides intestinigallinarum]|jgi:hypothetical protein|uniref:hypothetical protein n=1 Tax=Candidatus Bacteroides intestinigallinarum TaxID=2838470 RepID=UPI0039B3F7C3
MKALIYIIILLMSAICFISCRTQYIPVETVRTEYKARDSIRVDSIYNQDSIYVLVKGDTVYQYRYKYLYKYQYLNRTDTMIKIDSVQVPYPVEKQLTRWQQMKIELGGWAVGVIVILSIVLIVKLFKN